jgi:hypothetical protein
MKTYIDSARIWKKKKGIDGAQRNTYHIQYTFCISPAVLWIIKLRLFLQNIIVT